MVRRHGINLEVGFETLDRQNTDHGTGIGARTPLTSDGVGDFPLPLSRCQGLCRGPRATDRNNHNRVPGPHSQCEAHGFNREADVIGVVHLALLGDTEAGNRYFTLKAHKTVHS
jgi:hypothetical protein